MYVDIFNGNLNWKYGLESYCIGIKCVFFILVLLRIWGVR